MRGWTAPAIYMVRRHAKQHGAGSVVQSMWLCQQQKHAQWRGVPAHHANKRPISRCDVCSLTLLLPSHSAKHAREHAALERMGRTVDDAEHDDGNEGD